MTTRTHRPRRAGARWLVGAPAEVLDIWDNGGRTLDRITVYFFDPANGYGAYGAHAGETTIDYLGVSETGQGFSQWGEVTAEQRASLAYYKTVETGRRVTWDSLRPELRAHVIARMSEATETTTDAT